MNDPDIVRVADVSLYSGGVDPNPPRLNRTAPQQLLDQVLIESADPIFAESLIELNQSGGVGNWIHQRKMAKISPRKPFPDFPLHFFVAQPPAKFQVHHPQVDPYRSTGTTQSRIESLFKRLQQLRIGQKIIDLLQFVVQLVKRSIDKTITKTHLLRYGSVHDSLLYIIVLLRPKKIVTFSVRTN